MRRTDIWGGASTVGLKREYGYGRFGSSTLNSLPTKCLRDSGSSQPCGSCGGPSASWVIAGEALPGVSRSGHGFGGDLIVTGAPVTRPSGDPATSWNIRSHRRHTPV